MDNEYWHSPQGLRERMIQLSQNRDETPERVVGRAAAFEKYVKGDENGQA